MPPPTFYLSPPQPRPGWTLSGASAPTRVSDGAPTCGRKPRFSQLWRPTPAHHTPLSLRHSPRPTLSSPIAGLPQPDVVFYMDLSVEAAAQRGGFGGERYELPEFQRTVRARFDQLRSEIVARDPGQWQTVDASGTIDGIHAGLKAAATTRIAAVAGAPLRTLWTGEVMA
jgi:hypothetical protein